MKNIMALRNNNKGYYRVVSVGQLGFDYRSYCGRSHRIQGETGFKPFRATTMLIILLAYSATVRKTFTMTQI